MDVDETGVIFQLLRDMSDRQASDLHLVPGHPPTYRIHGLLTPTEGDELTGERIRDMLQTVLPQPHRAAALNQKNLDCSLSFDTESGPCRLRVNTFVAQGDPCACFRFIPNQLPTFDWMGFPKGLAERIVQLRNGLVVVTGVTGSGKTTTLAGIVNLLVQSGSYRIITVEQPTEYLFSSTGSSVITQREVGVDVDSFYDGLIYGLRQDPDVILVGEIRDRETATMALSAAETGHLIFCTLHTQDAKGAVSRLVDLFPHAAQDDVRSQLSLSLRYVVSQHLLPAATDGDKRALAIEVLHVTNAVKAAIRFGKIESIENAIQTGRRDGMTMFDESLARLASSGKITWETAERFAKDPTSVHDYAPSGGGW